MSQILVTHFLDNLLYKTMTEKLLAVRPEMWREGKKEKKLESQLKSFLR